MELKTEDPRGLLSLFDVRLCGIRGINEQNSANRRRDNLVRQLESLWA
jgi:hypothetical protein